MRDTGFTVPDGKIDRLTGFYRLDEESGSLQHLPDDLEDGAWVGRFELASTVDDYAAFGQMMSTRAGIPAGGCWRAQRSS